MTNKIMSIAAAAALFTSGAYAFDTNSSGTVLDNQGTPATFTVSAANTSAVQRNSDYKGDAIVYPAFNQDGTWGTEIVVRNNIGKGIVAKAVVYAADNSREIKDFNIYLSANDVCRFTVQGGKITSTDDSIVVSENIHDDTIHTFASAANPFSTDLAEKAGYIVVYGMGESNITAHGADAKVALFEDYRKALTKYRANWNDGLNMTNGVYTGTTNPVTAAPYIAATPDENTSLNDVNDTAFSGQVRIFNAADTTRDVLLNGTAVQNYTEADHVMLWAPGEYASMADRDMNATAQYDDVAVNTDAAVYLKTGAYYTYNNQGATPNVDNKLLLTQVYKRTLVQLGNTANYWGTRDCAETAGATTGMTFQANGSVWDESENQPQTTIGGGLIVSPANSGTVAGYCNELAEIAKPEAETDFADKNGYILYTFGQNGIPAIITQMSASKVGNDYRINWVNSVTNP